MSTRSRAAETAVTATSTNGSDSSTVTNNTKFASSKQKAPVAVVQTVVKQKRNPTVRLKDLRELSRSNKSRLEEILHFEPSDDEDCEVNSSDDPSSHDSDEGPVFRSWVEKSTKTEDFIQISTNFTIAEFQMLYIDIQDIIVTRWNVGSGRRSPVHPMDALLMVLAQLKQGTPFAATSKIFSLSGDAFRRLVDGFVEKCCNAILDEYIATDSMGDYRSKDNKFDHFPDVLEAIDVTFQKSYARGVDYEAKKIRFSGKHKAYGWKTEVAVGPDGRARFVSSSYPGSVHDMKMFMNHLEQHKNRLKKTCGPEQKRRYEH